MLLDIPRDSVPNFGEHYDDTFKFQQAEKEFLEDKINVRPFTIPFNGKDVKPEVISDSFITTGNNTAYILGGISINGTNHSVVVDRDGKIYDPSLDSKNGESTLVGPCTDGYYWVTILAYISI